ncbi:hypothetical protein HPB49_025635 [Dermacentor silvarum]|uniref:Uncharacterized protein n=1 Tax=Dermacentor silvarum TaxID=543639 RepID=A0ACB8CTY7_DERSI|nr:hypothetical protein HPB49_025635 [Dermacentor silvarum]
MRDVVSDQHRSYHHLSQHVPTWSQHAAAARVEDEVQPSVPWLASKQGRRLAKFRRALAAAPQRITITKIPPADVISGPEAVTNSGLLQHFVGLHRGFGGMFISGDLPEGCSELKIVFLKVPPTNVISGPQEVTKRVLLQLCVGLHRRVGAMLFSSDLPKDCSEKAATIAGNAADNDPLRKFATTALKRCSESKKIMFIKVTPTDVIIGPPEVTNSALLQLCVGLHRHFGAILFSGDLPEAVMNKSDKADAKLATDLLLGSSDVLLLLSKSVVLAVLVSLIGLLVLCVRYRQPSADEQPETEKQAASRVKWSLCFWVLLSSLT